MSERLDKLLALHQADPKDPFLAYGIALEHGKAGRSPEALAWLDKTLAIDAAYCYAYFQKAKAQAAMGQVDAARATLRAGIQVAQTHDAHAASEMSELMASLED